MTQKGIAKAVEANSSYVSVPIKEFLNKDYVRELCGRVKRGKRIQKYYTLTDKGRDYTWKLKMNLSKKQIKLKLDDGTLKSISLGNVIPYLQDEPVYSGIIEMDLYLLLTKKGIINIRDLRKKKKLKFVDSTSNTPMVTHFYGRIKECTSLDKWVEDKKASNILYLHGIAGIGKTTLVAKLIENYRGKRHLFWYNFNKTDTLRDVMFQISKFLSQTGYSNLEVLLKTRKNLDQNEILKTLIKNFNEINAILIIDDFHKSNEHLREFFINLITLYKPPSKAKIFILSRELIPLYDQKELLSNNTISELELDGLDYRSSNEFLEDRGHDKTRFQEIYKFTAGNPLFMELFESEATFEGYLYELFTNLWDDERHVLDAISVYRQPVQEGALLEHEDVNSDVLYQLIQKSYIKRDVQGRFFIHDCIKQFFNKRMTKKNRIKNHQFAAKWHENWISPDYLLEGIYHNIQAKRPERAVQIAIENHQSILDSGYVSRFLTILDDIDENEIDNHDLGSLFIIKGKAHYMNGDWRQSLLFYNKTSDIALEINDRKIIANAFCEMGNILEEQNELEKALSYYKKCIAISKEADCKLGIGKGNRGIGRIYWRKEEWKKALIYLKKGLEIFKDLNESGMVASTYIDMGNVYDEMHKTKDAIENYNRSLDLLKKVKNYHEISRAYGNLGVLYKNKGEFDKAIECNSKQLIHAKKLNDITLIGYGVAEMGYCHSRKGNIDEANKFVKQAEEIALKLENDNIMSIVNRTYSIIYKSDGRLVESVEYLIKCLEYLKQLDASHLLPEINLEIGLLYDEMGDSKNAKRYLDVALNHYEECNLKKPETLNKIRSKY